MIEGDAPDGPLVGMTCVCFGDSITGNYANPFDYPSIIARKTGMNVVNGGFGGCRMAQHPTNAYNAFSMHSLADSVASGDWSVQDAAVESLTSANAAEHLAALKEVDWSAVDYITIFYGTNDFTGGVPIGETENSLSTSQFKGALRHSIETILTAYPKIRIVLLTPIYRFWKESDVVTDSDAYEVSGLKLTDYVEAVIDIANEYKLPVFNLYNSLGINKLNRTVFLSDGVHPSGDGLDRIGESIAARLSAI
jgi:lysophospholipase L1-like esterase